MALRLRETSGRIVQLVAADPVARGAAAALRQTLEKSGKGADVRTLVNVDVGAGEAAVNDAVSVLGENDALVLWLRPNDLAGLAKLPSTTASVFASATLAGGEQAELPMSLRKRATMVQPLEEPHLRAANLQRFEAWLSGSNVPMVDKRMQSEVFFAARSLQATLRGMLNNLHTDYLIERAESTLSGFEAMEVQEEIQAIMMSPVNKRPPSRSELSKTAAAEMAAASKAQMDHLDEMRKRGGTTVYPRLSLGPGQRIASKGAYLESLNPNASGIVGKPEWVVP
jgi:hypothetical protein